MVIIYYIDDNIFNLNGFEDVSKNDLPGYVYRRLYQILSNRVEDLIEEKIRLLYNRKNRLFALTYDGICVVDGDEEDEEKFMEEFLLAD